MATFLTRCLFTMFAEDVGLLPENAFTNALEKFWIPSPASFPAGIELLWRTMNAGGQFGFADKILRFNGGLFASPTSLPLGDHALRLLLLAAKCDWSDVEPAIFGTLLERALDPKERHRLGAHYTPRAYVERLVRPTIEEPLRADWDIVQAHVRHLVIEAEDKAEKAKKKLLAEAVEEVRAFHQKLCKTRVLDPACGSGNFLYVTLDIFKRLEGEVLALLDSLGVTQQTLVHMEGVRVTPAQFHGIEIKRWAKEIAELVLWIGYLQWHFKLYGEKVPVPEPVLQDYKNIECRDAVLAYDREELVTDEKGKPVTRWDGETMKKSPVTGQDVPDERAQVPIYRYVNPRKAEWPEADFIVGNPPFIGNKRMRAILTDGYVEALRAVHPEVAKTADFVMYWWNEAAAKAVSGKLIRFGFITTNSITQSFNRQLIVQAQGNGLRVAFAIADHPWVDEASGAAVRIAMTVVDARADAGVLGHVVAETPGSFGASEVTIEWQSGRIRPDLTLGDATSEAVAPLRANIDLCLQGCKLVGPRHAAGFTVTPEERSRLVALRPDAVLFLPRYFAGNDLTKVPKYRYVVDFFGLSEEQAMRAFPEGFQLLVDRVKTFREQNRRETRARNWWLFGENAPKLRRANATLSRFIATSEVAKHRAFVFLPLPGSLADGSLAAIALDDAFVLGMLSSRLHLTWALAAGGTLEDRPRYQNGPCFLTFPFPPAGNLAADRVARLAESLDAHRKTQQAAHPRLTITGMYNVLEKLRSGEALTAKDKIIHEHGLVSVLKKLHDDLDAAVFEAYGWPHDLTDEQILEKLVALNKERAEEEKRGLIRWLRPEFQNPTGQSAAMKQVELPADEEADDDAPAPIAAPSAAAWPKKMSAQLQAVRDLVTRSSDEIAAADVARAFKGAKTNDVEELLESLAALGVLISYELVEGKRWRAARFTKSASVAPPST